MPGAQVSEHPALTVHKLDLLGASPEPGNENFVRLTLREVSDAVHVNQKTVAQWSAWTIKEAEGILDMQWLHRDEFPLLCRPCRRGEGGYYFQPVTCPNGDRIAILSTPPWERIGEKGRPKKGESSWLFARAVPAAGPEGFFSLPDWITREG